MASGETYTTNLTDSLNSLVASARAQREWKGVMTNLVDKQTLDPGTGITWNEVSYARLTASSASETDRFENPQQFSDSNFPLTPSLKVVHTVITNRVAERISKIGFAKMGTLAQNAIQRLKDQDLLLVFDGASVSQPGAGATLTSGVVSAMAAQVAGNTTEPWDGPIYGVFHGFQIHDFYSELTSGVGTYPVPDGLTKDTFTNGFEGRIGGAEVYNDGNLTIDSSSDAKGGVFAGGKGGAIVLVQGRSPWTTTRDEPSLGGGGKSVWLWDEYATGERSAGNWLKEVYSDATAPTS
ncbi:MAG: hypothetical protein Q7O66_17485 [Dehalococcoidia bacterium]|nr:hypothetical protein [Dehalococcoidia bacterium]